MNLGSTPNINLSEAARLLKQSNVGINSIQNQQVPPPMMFMQQAVAMQQFQFQQALLMQQVMATQQAAARAATVKSAQEMAAARAKEISKLLKGIESDIEEKKKSPRRFISQTPSRSRSHSRSFSRSKSRSPIRYRRDRSTSRSPIQYRRGSRPSPILREYFGYRGRSRRGYYRGHREYGWNPSYHHDWERERDHYSLYLHRSRSRSRSQVSRRSHTPSHSPRYKRERSITPSRFHHKEERSQHSFQHLRSLETKPIPSCSHSRSYSRSRSESPHDEHYSQSPIQMPEEKKIRENHNETRKLSVVLGDGRCTSMINPNTNGIKETFYPTTIINENEGIVEHWKFRSKNKTKQSISPTRSLSISLSSPKRKERGKLEKEAKSNDWKKEMVRSVLFQRIDEVVAIDEPLQNNRAPFVDSEDGKGNPNTLVEQQTGIEGDVKSKKGKFEELNEQCTKKEFDKMKLSFDENDRDDKEVDDWQDEIEANELEKIKQKEYEEEMEKNEEEEKNFNTSNLEYEDGKDHAMTLLEHFDIDIGSRELRVESSIAFEDQGNPIFNNMSNRSTPNNDVIFAKLTSSNETLLNDLCIKEEILNMMSNGNREGDVEIHEEIEGTTNEKNTTFDDVIDTEGNLDPIFEGPMLPPDLDVEISEENNYAMKLCCKNVIEKVRPKKLSVVVVEDEVVIFKKNDKSTSKEVDDVHGLWRSKDKPLLKDDNQLHENCKSKEKSQLRKRNRNKSDKIENKKRKEKHRKHSKKHRKNEDIEKEENENDENKDVDFSKNKEERHCYCNKKYGRDKNCKEDKHRKKRHRHKHRGKLTLEPLDKESLVVEVEAEDVD